MMKLKKRRPIKDIKRAEVFVKKLWLRDTYLQRIFENDSCSQNLFETAFAIVLCYAAPPKRNSNSTIGRVVLQALATHPLFTKQHLEQLINLKRIHRKHLSTLVAIHKTWMLELKELIRQTYMSSFNAGAKWHNQYLRRGGPETTGEELFEKLFQTKSTSNYKRPDKFLEDFLADLNDVMTLCTSEQTGNALLSDHAMLRNLTVYLNKTKVGEIKDGT